jgi:S-adenosylmethionine decarboxylase
MRKGGDGMFGPHLVLEGYGGDAKLLGDVGHTYRVLDEYPAFIGMTKIMPPHVQQYLDRESDIWGVSGFVIIAESHIAIHTFPEQNFLTLDIFSCKDFDIQPAIDYITKKYRLKRHVDKLFNRGEDYPRSAVESSALISSTRRNLKVVGR